MTGDRKLRMFTLAVGALGGGLVAALIAKASADSAFSSFCMALVGILTAAVGGNVGEHLANRPPAPEKK